MLTDRLRLTEYRPPFGLTDRLRCRWRKYDIVIVEPDVFRRGGVDEFGEGMFFA
jgi:hypothetical protein